MAVTRLMMTSVRNLRQADLAMGTGLNILVGPNGSGKSSVLESVYLLSQGRSFRSGATRQLISNGEKALAVSASLQTRAGQNRQLGISLSGNERIRRMDGAPCERQAELAALLPVVLLQPSAQILLESAPELRRQYLDWGAFQRQGATFLGYWRRYGKCLEQRNALLRHSKASAELAVWETELDRYGNALAQARADYLAQLTPYLEHAFTHLAGDLGPLSLSYAKGWPDDAGLAEMLSHSRDKDRRLGFTSLGPHRADFRLAIAGVSARQLLSRGQLKLAVAALKLSQAKQAYDNGSDVCLLMDDLSSELDPANRRILLDYVAATGLQTLATGTCAEQFDGICFTGGGAVMFHVEHGKLTPA